MWCDWVFRPVSAAHVSVDLHMTRHLTLGPLGCDFQACLWAGFPGPGSEGLACSLETFKSASQSERLRMSAQKDKGLCTFPWRDLIRHHCLTHKYLIICQASNKTTFTEIFFFKLFITFKLRSAWPFGDLFRLGAQGSTVTVTWLSNKVWLQI